MYRFTYIRLHVQHILNVTYDVRRYTDIQHYESILTKPLIDVSDSSVIDSSNITTIGCGLGLQDKIEGAVWSRAGGSE